MKKNNMDFFAKEKQIIIENMAKLYEHTDKIIKEENREVLVDIKFKITEKEVDEILIKNLKELAKKYNKEFSREEWILEINNAKSKAIEIINKYRGETNPKIKKLDENKIEER